MILETFEIRFNVSNTYQKGDFMKTNLTSRLSLLALLMVVLILSIPFTTFAQQKSVEVQAEMAAERDAKADVNKLLWTGAGPLFCLLGAISGGSVAEISDRGGASIEGIILSGVCVGGSVCGLFSLGVISYRSYPPSERLIGKSPEYVGFYTAAYEREIRLRRAKHAAAGALPFYGLMLLIGGVIEAAGE